MSIGRVALIGGQGWPATETVAGLPTLAHTLAAHGFELETFAPENRIGVRSFLYGYNGFRACVGDSLGAARSAEYPEDLTDGPTHFAGGFQPSAWDPTGSGPLTDRVITVSIKVQAAFCIWDPNFVDTGGLGNAHYVLPVGSRTVLTVKTHPGLHPDDWGIAQAWMIEALLAARQEYGA